ncbi:MAG: hypothetical protein H7839_09230 [Magnetococcus sp. YQC-5]
MLGIRAENKLAQTSKITTKILGILYVCGTYGLIMMAVIQGMILVSWIRH